MSDDLKVHGDWRDQAEAMRKAYVDLGRLTEEESKSIPREDWALVEAVLKRYAPLQEAFPCAHCQRKGKIFSMYRCYDCKALLCESCCLSHFGAQHKPHA